jgi:glutamate-1-semialdehyde aminotransferase
LPGLEPSGVPTVLAESAVPFSYNDVDELEAIARGNTIGTIVVEPVRHDKPKSDFLANVREIAVQCNAVLIFDEITSGWRMNVGGIHELYGVYPDIAVYGKAMSNGFPMAAVVGRQEVMSLAETCFISSTYWTERIGPVASLATINKMHDENVPPHLIDIGQMIGNGWRRLADENELKIEVMDAIPPLTTFSFLERDSQALITLFTQEMLDRGFLASKSVYVSYAHSRDVVQKYLEAVDEAFFVLKQALERNNVLELVRGPIAQTGFKRLTR